MHTREEEAQDPTKRYDTRDLPMKGVIRGVLWFFIGTLAMGPISCAAMWAVGGEVGKPYLGHEPLPLQDSASYKSRRLPGEPNPLLQDNVTAKADIHNLRKAENELLERGGINPTTQTRAIPVAQALEEEANRQGK